MLALGGTPGVGDGRLQRGMVVDDAAEDARLARLVAAGDRDAELALCRRMLPRVRAWGLKHLRDEAAARDLAQQAVLVMIEAVRARRVEQVDRIGAFVLGVCKHTLEAWQRGERRRAALLDRYGPTFDGIAELADEALDRRRLQHCFELLAPRARAVIALTFFAERDGDDIARELGVSAGNVRVVRHRALAQLHDCVTGAA